MTEDTGEHPRHDQARRECEHERLHLLGMLAREGPAQSGADHPTCDRGSHDRHVIQTCKSHGA